MKKIWQHLKRPPWRTLVPLLVLFLVFLAWAPGERIRDGRHDLRSNGIWLQHGWLGDDGWFLRNKSDKALFRDPRRIQELADLLANHGVKYVYPHLCPCDPDGRIASVDSAQTERFPDRLEGFTVLPWIGGVLDNHCSPESDRWRQNFITSAVDLLQAHPRLGGVHVNIEPMPTGNQDFLVLLDELRKALPERRILSVAAYPPPTRWHPYPEVHWDEACFRQVAGRTDQLAVMMYDTGIRVPKLYRYLMSAWTAEVLDWSGSTEVLLGVPVYEDSNVGYHHPYVENMKNALAGIHAGLGKYAALPENYAGIAIYCEWEMDEQKWDCLAREFEDSPAEEKDTERR